MPVHLLPYQKMVDMPEAAQHYRREICALAITSIILAFLNLIVAFVSTEISDFNTATRFWFMFVIPCETFVLFLLVLASGIVAICNTDRWVSTDKCCNLMRTNPACCTKCCGGNKHCFARLSVSYITTSVYANLSLLIAGLALISGSMRCNDEYYYGSHLFSSDYELSYMHYYTEQYNSRYSYDSQSVCVQVYAYQIPSLVLLLCLVAITARLAWSIRQIENNQADIAVLPPTKMMTLRVIENEPVQSIALDEIADNNNEKTDTGSETEVVWPECTVSS